MRTTMINILLFRYGQLCAEDRAETEKAADRALDRLITAVLQGKHGNGEFYLVAKYVDDIGAKERWHFTCRCVHPAPPRVKPA
jgi:hypothetical protein